METFLNSLGVNLLYLALLSVGIIYAVVILISGALQDIHIPGVDLQVGSHDIPIHVETPPTGLEATIDHPTVKIPSLSPITIASFVTAFGAFGLISQNLFNISPRGSLFWAAVGGVVIAAIAHFAFGYFLIAPQGSSEVRLSDIVGITAEVITPIPADSVGEVAFVAQGGRITYTAKSATSAPIPRGTTVTIEKIVGGVALVKIGETAKFEAETKIVEAQKNYSVQKAAYDADVNQKKAESELAYPLQQNITNQKVKAEEVEVEVVEKRKQIEVQEQEVLRREKELEATIRKPAEAEQFRIRTLAEAKKFQLEIEAQGQMAATRNLGVGEADANKARGLAQADVIRAQGLTQADVIQAQGLAEALATSKKAEAWEQYTQAAILQQILDKLPQLANAIAQPLAKTDKIVIVSTGGDSSSGAGVSRITRDVANVMAQIPEVVEALTGIKLTDLLSNLPAVKAAMRQEKVKPSTEEKAPGA